MHALFLFSITFSLLTNEIKNLRNYNTIDQRIQSLKFTYVSTALVSGYYMSIQSYTIVNKLRFSNVFLIEYTLFLRILSTVVLLLN